MALCVHTGIYKLLIKRYYTITQGATNCNNFIYYAIICLFITRLIGKVDSSRSKPITLSTWILTRDNCLAVSTSNILNCFFSFVNGGNFTSAQYSPTASWTLKPQSASVMSPGWSKSSIPHFSVISWSETLPPHPLMKSLLEVLFQLKT